MKPRDRIFAKTAQSALKISNWTFEEKASQPAQTRISQVPVQKRHSLRSYSSLETISHHQIVSLIKLANEITDLVEIVAIVRISHDNEISSRGGNASPQCAAVATDINRYNPRTKFGCDGLGTIRAAIVRYDHLSAEAETFHCYENLVYTGTKGRALIQTGHYDGQL